MGGNDFRVTKLSRRSFSVHVTSFLGILFSTSSSLWLIGHIVAATLLKKFSIHRTCKTAPRYHTPPGRKLARVIYTEAIDNTPHPPAPPVAGAAPGGAPGAGWAPYFSVVLATVAGAVTSPLPGATNPASADSFTLLAKVMTGAASLGINVSWRDQATPAEQL